ncbi:uncharacterized protein LOC119287847 [Triticum dicoccoides]|uniref:uncharacterized protein LOC119287847 n=1 Tax=Triticum dicoccoides TaxID=85692 RepID=UPI0018907B45|nr:uncharacterized protein LOC119287847 [Triticum dicoccoides]
MRHRVLTPTLCAVAPFDIRWLLPKPRLTDSMRRSTSVGCCRSRALPAPSGHGRCAHHVRGAANATDAGGQMEMYRASKIIPWRDLRLCLKFWRSGVGAVVASFTISQFGVISCDARTACN